eukprot:64243_1
MLNLIFNNFAMSHSKWKECDAHQTTEIYPQIINIEDSLWYSTSYRYGEHGMVEYCIKTNKIKQIVTYPKHIRPDRHALCEYNNIIYIIDAGNGNIISFNPFTNQFKQKLKVSKIGYFVSCVLISDKIHIFNGTTNQKHFVYSITNNKIQTFNHDTITYSNILFANIIYYNKQIIKFGGFNFDKKKYINNVIISPIIKGYTNMKWSQQINCELPTPMANCGYILYNNYVITFGGETHGWFGHMFLDNIFVLNLNNINKGWIKLNHIKCPLKSQYISVLDKYNNVHLFTKINKCENC